MADHQRIHPVDLEAGNPPTATLVPGGSFSFRSDKDKHQQGYVPGPLPPPPRRVAPSEPLLPAPLLRGDHLGRAGGAGVGSSLGVWYQSLPAFYQGHRNTTVLRLAMAGKVTLGGAAVVAGMVDAEAERQGAVPLVFRADVPVRVGIGALKLRTVTSRVRCDLVVDRLMGVGSPKITACNCKFSFKL